MTEQYIHYLWQVKKLPLNLHLSDGKELSIQHFGQYNTFESGPDFHNGIITIDGQQVCGNIEMHLKSSDWNLHGHQHDEAYNNVILHVVYEHDCEIQVQGRKLPVLELKPIISDDHYLRYLKMASAKDDFACCRFFDSIDSIYIEKMKETSLIARLERKARMVNDLYTLNKSSSQTLYSLVAKSFGNKSNDLPFVELSNRIPYRILQKEQHVNEYALLLEMSGLNDRFDKSGKVKEVEFLKRKYDLSPMNGHSWKYKGIRPPAFPHVTLQKFALFIQHFRMDNPIMDFSVEQIIQTLHTLIDFPDSKSDDSNPADAKSSSALTKNSINNVLINAIAPYWFWHGEKNKDFELMQRSINLLEHLPAENNYILRKWKTLGHKAKTAYDSQALLEIFSEFCQRKRCMSCDVGNQILKQ